MNHKNIYKVAFVTGAMAASGFAFAAYTGGLASSSPSATLAHPQTAIEQKDTDKETADDTVASPKTSVNADKKDANSTVSDENDKETADDGVLPAGSISEDVAKKAVLAAYPQATIVGIEIETDGGKSVYNVSLKDGTDVKVDTSKGVVVGSDKRGDEGKVASDKDKETADDSVNSSNDHDTETND